MRINKRFLNEIIKRLDIVSASGRSTIEQIMISAPQDFDFNRLYEYVVAQYMPIVEACSDDAAVVGASAYDAFREIELGETLGAQPYSAFVAENTDDAIRAFVNSACEEHDLSQLIGNLGKRLDAEVMRSYSNTHITNGRYDTANPRFARVPSGPDPCDFCRALAGHGFYYSSKKAAGDTGGQFNSYHDFCRCQVVPEFSKEANALQVAGYDPDKFVKEWRESGKTFGTSSGHKKINPVGRKKSAMPKIDDPILKEVPPEAKLPSKVYGGEWDQEKDMDTFLKTMFEDDEYVGTCSEFYTTKDGRRAPTKGLYQRTAGQIENVLENTHNVSSAVGRYHTADGAYVRINPLDGRGVSDESVAAFKYTLIECDTLSMEQQYGFVKALNLPTQTITTSGGKSLHAVVKIDANNLDQYRERVALLHAECKASGFDVDAATKNPSRYMRIPGVKRGNGRQVLVSTGEGATSWDDWRSWCESQRGN